MEHWSDPKALYPQDAARLDLQAERHILGESFEDKSATGRLELHLLAQAPIS